MSVINSCAQKVYSSEELQAATRCVWEKLPRDEVTNMPLYAVVKGAEKDSFVIIKRSTFWIMLERGALGAIIGG